MADVTRDVTPGAAPRDGSDGATTGTTTAANREVILSVRDVGVDFRVNKQWVMASSAIDFDVRRGETLAIVGESGSGKSVTSMGLIGLMANNGRIHGSAKLLGQELIGTPERILRTVRGGKVGLIFQEPMTALNPVLTIGFQISEMLLSHLDITPAEAKERAIELMRMVEMPDPEKRYDAFPHQLSGGQRQRIVIAIAIACDPVLLIADEPTTALDVTVQAEILDLMRHLKDRLDSAIILITHDMGVVADLADEVVVMRDGLIVERAEIHELYHHPQTDYTRELLAAVPHLGSQIELRDLREAEAAAADSETGAEAASEAGAAAAGQVTLSAGQPAAAAPAEGPVDSLVVDNLVIEFPGRFSQPAFRAVDQVSFRIGRGEVFGLVGESGSGKTTIGRAVVGLQPSTSGGIVVGGTNIVGMKEKQLRPLRRRFAIVFQDPAASLNPRMTIGESIGEPILLHDKAKRAEIDRRVEDLLDAVNLPTAYRNRYPHELSGGQRQRVGIARALALQPELLVADEPTSALDVSIQAHVLELFQSLQARYGFACLFISHDLAVVEILASRIGVLHKGRLVEVGPREQVLAAPQDPYTRRLLAAAPVPDPDEQARRREDRRALLAAGVS
ncbi:MAG: ABC transporter ATP-binding protein [Propionibacteriaceae bacterium]|jgi:peptide/nickel transport system ATP-binding protein|nr:ABC transporter ATP-binding protein [Propionibacteriaceae bacterium]